MRSRCAWILLCLLAGVNLARAASPGAPAFLAITGGNNQIGPANAPLPLPLTVSVTSSSGAGLAGVTVDFGVTSGAGSVSAPAVQTDSTGTASVTLTLGAQPGNVTVTAAIAGSAVAPVHFAEMATSNSMCQIDPPQITTINYASDYGAFPYFSSGAYLEVHGTNLAIDSRQWGVADFSGDNAPISLDGSRVAIDGLPAYVYYISSGQINVQAPADPTTGMVPISVTNCAGASNTVLFTKDNIAPGMLAPASFYVGKQYLVALFAADLSLGITTYVGRAGLVAGANFRPAKPGDVIVVYGLGFGNVVPATPPGVIASGATNLTGFSISFGGAPASTSYRGLYPGFVGLYEFFVTVPNIVNGDYQISISINGTAVPQTFYLTVQQ